MHDLKLKKKLYGNCNVINSGVNYFGVLGLVQIPNTRVFNILSTCKNHKSSIMKWKNEIMN